MSATADTRWMKRTVVMTEPPGATRYGSAI